MNALDTNILVYAHDSRDPRKQAIAGSLVEDLDDGALLWQVACEFLSASRKLEPFGYGLAQAWQNIQDLYIVWKTILPSWNTLARAQVLCQRCSISHWDALLLSACREAGIARLYSGRVARPEALRRAWLVSRRTQATPIEDSGRATRR